MPDNLNSTIDQPAPLADASPLPTSPSLKQQAEIAIQLAMQTEWQRLAEEVLFRARVYERTQDAALASSESRWAAEMARPDAMNATSAQLVELARSILGKEMCRRLCVADVCLTEALYSRLREIPGMPVWTQREHTGEGLFYLGKAGAVAEAVGLVLYVLVAEFVLEVMPCARPSY
jgi:hypothetical protein